MFNETRNLDVTCYLNAKPVEKRFWKRDNVNSNSKNESAAARGLVRMKKNVSFHENLWLYFQRNICSYL